jgi:hypothetical protein
MEAVMSCPKSFPNKSLSRKLPAGKPLPRIILGPAARQSVHNNTEKLEKQAAAVAESITIPSGVEFARFDHAGKTYAISVKLLVEVDLLNSRVPDVVVRTRPNVVVRTKPKRGR